MDELYDRFQCDPAAILGACALVITATASLIRAVKTPKPKPTPE